MFQDEFLSDESGFGFPNEAASQNRREVCLANASATHEPVHLNALPTNDFKHLGRYAIGLSTSDASARQGYRGHSDTLYSKIVNRSGEGVAVLKIHQAQKHVDRRCKQSILQWTEHDERNIYRRTECQNPRAM